MILRSFGADGDPRAAARAHPARAAVCRRGWTRIRISSGSRRCRSASCASAGIRAGRRSRPTELDAANERLLDLVNQTGDVFLSHTKLREGVALRLAIGHLDTTERHIKRAFELLIEKAGL